MREIVTSFLKIGATAYGGPAIMEMMQAEFQERRQGVSKLQLLEGLSLVNMPTFKENNDHEMDHS